MLADLADHPLPRLLDAGLRVCLDTDDPGWFATDLVTESALALQHFGLGRAQHVEMQLDAVAASFASESRKASLRAELVAVHRPERPRWYG